MCSLIAMCALSNPLAQTFQINHHPQQWDGHIYIVYDRSHSGCLGTVTPVWQLWWYCKAVPATHELQPFSSLQVQCPRGSAHINMTCRMLVYVPHTSHPHISLWIGFVSNLFQLFVGGSGRWQFGQSRNLEFSGALKFLLKNAHCGECLSQRASANVDWRLQYVGIFLWMLWLLYLFVWNPLVSCSEKLQYPWVHYKSNWCRRRTKREIWSWWSGWWSFVFE